MKYIYLLIAFMLFACAPAFATTSTINQFATPPGGVVLGTASMLYQQGPVGTGTTYSSPINNIVAAGLAVVSPATIWGIISTASGLCSAVFSPNGDPCTLFFGYADPRAYGATCSGQTVDDTNGLTAATKNAYRSPVNIPSQSCQLVHPITYDRTGIVFFGNPTTPSYNAVNDLNKPYIFLNTNTIGESIAFNTNHQFGWAFVSLNMVGTWPAPGTAAIGNHSGAAGSYFGDIRDVGISNVSTDIGESTKPFGSGSMCQPDALTSGTGLSFVAHNLRMANSCNGMVQNIFDTFIDETYCTTMMGNCLASTGGSNNFGINAEIGMLRTEYAGAASYDGTYQHNGDCIYYNSTGSGYLGLHINQLEADHCNGPAVEMGPLAAELTIAGGGIQDSNQLAATGILDTHILMQAGATGLFWSGTFMTNNGHPTHAFTTNGNVDYVYISGMNNLNASTGSFYNITGTIPHFTDEVQGNGFRQSDGLAIGIGTATPIAGFSLQTGADIDIAASGYLNWGATDGSSGYGIRDSGGVIQCKNSGGSWSPCASTGALTPTSVLASAFISITPQPLTIISTAVATNAALGNYFYVTLTHTASTAVSAPTNPLDGQTLTYELTQDGTGTNLVGWNAVFDFGASGTPTLSTAAAAVDVIGFRYSARLSKWLYTGSVLGN